MLARTRRPDAVKSFESALSMSGDFRYSDSARYLLGTTLRELGEYDRAIAVFREIEELERDTNVLAEVRYWLAYSLVRAGQKDQGAALFNQIVDGGGRHASSARRELSALTRRTGSVSKLSFRPIAGLHGSRASRGFHKPESALPESIVHSAIGRDDSVGLLDIRLIVAKGRANAVGHQPACCA